MASLSPINSLTSTCLTKYDHIALLTSQTNFDFVFAHSKWLDESARFHAWARGTRAQCLSYLESDQCLDAKLRDAEAPYTASLIKYLLQALAHALAELEDTLSPDQEEAKQSPELRRAMKVVGDVMRCLECMSSLDSGAEGEELAGALTETFEQALASVVEAEEGREGLYVNGRERLSAWDVLWTYLAVFLVGMVVHERLIG